MYYMYDTVLHVKRPHCLMDLETQSSDDDDAIVGGCGTAKVWKAEGSGSLQCGP